MELQYIKNLSKSSADIYLYDEIGYGVNAQAFVNELNYLINVLQIPVVNIRINSPGGSVFDGLGIFAAIANSKSEVNTYIDGLAASAAGFIAMAGHKRYMASHAKLMMHNVSWGSSNDPKEQKKIDTAIDALEDSIATILSNNSGLSKEDVRAKMNKETWLSANEAMELKFIDGVYDPTPKKRMAKSELMELVNSIQKPNNITMDKVLNCLNLTTGTNEDTVVEKIKNIQTDANKVEALEKENKELTEKLEAKENEAKVATATTEVKNQIAAGKFSADKEADLIAFATKDIEAFKNLSASIAVSKAPDLSNMINQKKVDGEDRSTWTIRDWEIKDSAGLQNIINNEPETYKRLFDAYYKQQ